MSRLGEKVRPQRWASSSPASHSKPPTLWFSPSLWGGLDGPFALKTEVTVGQKPKGSDSSYAGGGDSQMLFFFAIHDKHCFELPFIQILTCTLLSGIHSGVLWEIFDDISFSEISQPCFDPVVVAGVCITSKYFCETQQGKPIRWMKIGLMCLQKISKQH